MIRLPSSTRRPAALVFAVTTLLATLLSVAAAPASLAAPTVIASDMTAGGPVGLLGFDTDAPVFSSAGDGFQKYQRGVSPSIPFAVVDDSLVTFPGDSQGIVDDNNPGEFFGIVDTINGDNPGNVAYNAIWQFDIAGQTDLSLSIDMGAMGDFETSDTFVWSYSLDGAFPATTVFELVVDEAATRSYTLADGQTYALDDPLNVGAVELSNVLQPVTAPITGTGTVLTVTLTASTDGGSEGDAFQNLRVVSDPEGGGGVDPVPGDLVITEVMQNPAAVGDSSGEWFEIQNRSAQAVDLDGWTISDNGSDTHVIAGPLEVPAGGAVVLGNNGDLATNGGAAVDYSYGTDFFLSNSDDELVLTAPDLTEFDRIEWDGGPVWPDPTGAAMQLDPVFTSATDNDDGATWCTASAPYGAGDLGTPGTANPACIVAPTTVKIHEIQGTGSAVAITTPVQVEAVVTSLFTRDDVLDGFFVQEEDGDADADPATSEGIFVFCRGNCPTEGEIAPGTVVAISGTPTDFFGMSQLDMTGGNLSVIGTASLPSPTPITLPAGASTLAEATFEPLEGMLVEFTGTLAVSEYFQLGRYGQIVLTDTARPFQFTHMSPPSASGYAAFLADLETRRIILDDDNNDQNDPVSDGPDEVYPLPEGGLSLTNRFRGGDTITGLTGVLHWSFAGQPGTDAWRVRPVPEVFDYTFAPTNPQPITPTSVGGTLTVGSFNVLNYFSTIDETAANDSGPCGPSALLDCRGADSASELMRQRDKIVAAISTLDADVLGLVELQNDGDDASVSNLVAGLNAVGGPTYDFVATGYIGDDAIKVGLIYQPANVTPVGTFAVLDDSVDPTFVQAKNRPVLIQTFEEVATGERFTIAVNHLKSKGSDCDDLGDPDRNDGQARCPGTRTAGAAALAAYLATDPTGSGDPDFLIVGDLNAYAMEDPIQALVGAGYTDLVALFEGPESYSFVFDGQLGYLDHALANPSLLEQVTGVATWHINADEVNLFDYNDDVRDTGEASFERESVLAPYAPDAFRSSDHDPVVVGLTLSSTPTCNGKPATIIGTDAGEYLWGTPGDDVILALGGNDVVVGYGGDDTICLGAGRDWAFGMSGADVVLGEGGRDAIYLGPGADFGDGGDGRDFVSGQGGADEVVGGPGNDVLLGGGNDDALDGGDGDDYGNGGRGTDACMAIEITARCELAGPLP